MRLTLSVGCRILAVMAWVITLAWFALATAAGWGYTPGGLVLWSGPALLLLHLTTEWWARVGHPLSPSIHSWLMRIWRNLFTAAIVGTAVAAVVGAAFGDARWFEWLFAAVLLVF